MIVIKEAQLKNGDIDINYMFEVIDKSKEPENFYHTATITMKHSEAMKNVIMILIHK